MTPRRAFDPMGLGRFFGPGELRLALLSLVAEKPGHGYDLMGRLEGRFDGGYQASAGAIYPTLQQLEDQELVRLESGDGRKVYHATPAGLAEVAAHAEEITAIWSRASSRGQWGMLRDPRAAEVVGPVLRLAKAAVKAIVHAHGDPDAIDRIRSIVDAARHEIERTERRRHR